MNAKTIILKLFGGALLGVSICSCSNEESKPEQAALKEKLTPMQYQVTMENGTEPAFRNEYYDNHKAGVYVSVVSGEPLFSSKDKFDSGTGWPSFSKPIAPDVLVDRKDLSAGMDRMEIRSKKADTHLGHLFNDGPPPSRLRYCINSAALDFIPAGKLVESGFPDLAKTFSASQQPSQ